MFAEAREIFTRLDDRRDLAPAFNALGAICKSSGQYQPAIERHERTLELFR